MVRMIKNVSLVVDGKKLISIQNLLIWAVRDECVMDWLNVEHDRLGGMRSQLGALILQCEQGGRVDGGGDVATCRMPDDAMRVGFAIDALGRADKRLVIEHARHGDTPFFAYRSVGLCECRWSSCWCESGANYR